MEQFTHFRSCFKQQDKSEFGSIPTNEIGYKDFLVKVEHHEEKDFVVQRAVESTGNARFYWDMVSSRKRSAAKKMRKAANS